MGLRINTNVQSLAAQRSINQVKTAQDKTLQKLSSGSRIVRSADDAAGLAISEKLKAEIRGTQQANRNAGDGISLIQVAEGGLNEVSNILIRLRELSVQAASDTVGENERGFLDLEYQQLTEEVDRIAQATKFNGKDLLNGQGDQYDFQIGTMNRDGIDRITFDASTSDATADNIGVGGTGVLTKDEAQANLETIDMAINKVNGNRATLGALQNRLQSTIANLEIKNENLSAANSRVRDADVALETSELAKSSILLNASTSSLAQANSQNTLALKLIG